MKIETNYKKKNFYTEQEVKEIREKMSDIKLPNNHRNMKITDLIKEYGAEKARKLVEEEVYLFKHSLIMLELSEGYKMINGHENDMIDYTFKNQNEIMKNSMYEYIGVSDTMLSSNLNYHNIIDDFTQNFCNYNSFYMKNSLGK